MNTIIKESVTDTVNGHVKYVLDIPYLFPKDVKFIDTNDVIVIFMGYAHTTKEEVLSNIRKCDKDNYWCKNISDEELLIMIEHNIEFSKYLEEECKRLGITYFDTSVDRDKVLNEIKNYIEIKF